MSLSGRFHPAVLAAGIIFAAPALAQAPILVPPPPAPPKTPVEVRTPVPLVNESMIAFQQRYAELRTAMQAHDEATIDTLVAPDFTLTDIRGDSHSREDMLNRGGRMGGRGGGQRGDAPPPGKDGDKGKAAAQLPERKIEQTVLAVAVNGNTATVDQQLAMSGTREDDEGNTHAMEMTMRATDTWAKQGQAWVLKSSVQKDMTVKRDGDVVFHQGS